MIALGIDPSYTCSALVWLTQEPGQQPKLLYSRKLKIPPTEKRLVYALREIKSALASAPLAANVIAIEDTIWTRRSRDNDLIEFDLGRRTVKKMIELNAIYKLLIQDLGLEPLEISPTSIKQWLTGNGDAPKPLVAQELLARYGISFEKDRGHDLSDAAAVALWALSRRGATE